MNNGKVIKMQIQKVAFQMIRNAMIRHFVLNSDDLLILKHLIIRLFIFFCIAACISIFSPENIRL